MSTSQWLDILRAAALDAMAAAAGPSPRRTTGGSGAHLGTNPPELCGTWTFYDSANAYNGGYSSSEIGFTLNRDGRYTFGSERSMSAYVYGQGMLTNGSDSDAGQWSVEGDVLIANSHTRGMQRFRLTKANHPKTGEAMLHPGGDSPPDDGGDGARGCAGAECFD